IGLPGDANDDGVVNPADVFYLVAFLYSGGPAPLGVADANFDERVDALDLFYLINFLYAGGPEPQ
ncbi:MAG TPA: dockerin type I domain-containing protein, partial [Thermoanaerobaculia bacterium]|nr:dockerin type I domain-containing protein [Thermoanaerobaculia bacterium]